MPLDDISVAIGRLTASHEQAETRMARIEEKLDKLLSRSERQRLTLKHWAALLTTGALGGGGVAHALRKIFE